MSGPGALCVWAWRFVSGPGGPLPALFLSGPCVGHRRSVCRGPALFVSGTGALYVGARRSFYRAPALSVRVCLEPGLFLYRSSALFSALCLGARRSPAVSLCRGPALCVGVCVGAGAFRRCRSLCRCFCQAAAGSPASSSGSIKAGSFIRVMTYNLSSTTHSLVGYEAT